ncbi:molecular chaperone DnaJ [Marichromatium gracile]|uniref:molecular chaperone DnaJ n=1 Tax=Marichromatium gracile TaxID=1048 RepID=UPI001F454ACE|nr:molecular chaperone DnaJ [Marichromatium gracile]MCF1182601.1 molecular chaperone DnaJ [Marichromatium gracile]
MARLLVLIALLVLLWWGWRWFVRTPAPEVARALRGWVVWGLVGLLVLAAATGRLNPLFAALGAAIPVVLRIANLAQLLPLLQRFLGRGRAGQGPRLRSRYLELELDAGGGALDGQVLDGPFAGRRLSALDREALARMLEFYRESDAESAQLLETYLSRARGWSGAGGGSGGAGSGRPSPSEARAILGLGEDAGPDEIRAAHRRLMQRLHPDRGGSDYLAARINAAKQVLLEE